MKAVYVLELPETLDANGNEIEGPPLTMRAAVLMHRHANRLLEETERWDSDRPSKVGSVTFGPDGACNDTLELVAIDADRPPTFARHWVWAWPWNPVRSYGRVCWWPFRGEVIFP